MVESSQGEPTKRRAALYIDGFNLYHAVNDLGENFLKWCNFWRLGETIIPSAAETLVKVVFCTAFYPNDFGKKVRHDAFIKALALTNVETITGHFIIEPANCISCKRVWEKPTEKASDIHLALSIFEDASKDIFDVAYLLTADGDQAATARFVKERFPHKKVVSVSPPGRPHSQHILKFTGAKNKVALNRDHIERALFRGLVTAPGMPPVRRPAEYDPPAGYVHWDDRPKAKTTTPPPAANTPSTPATPGGAAPPL